MTFGTASERGQGIVEYALILVLSVVVAVLVLLVFGDVLSEILEAIGRAIDETT